MSDLRPLLKGDPSEAEKLLLGSAGLDAPPPAVKARVLAGLGVATVTTTTVGARGATAAAKTWAAVATKWLAICAIGGAISLGPIEGLRPWVHRRANPSSPVALPTSLASPLLSEVASKSPIAESESKPEPEPPSSPAHAPEVSESKAPRAVRAPVPAMRAIAITPTVPAPPPADPAPGEEPTFGGSPEQPTLTAEVIALEEARGALASGNAARSLSLLDSYDRRFPRPVLTSEVTVLRVETLAALGRIEEARAVAAAMLAAQPDSPYAQRVRSLIGSP
jgi:hypothetical protein